MLEARDRIGGRVWTVHDPGLAVPIELGAEFVHGAAPPVEEVARAARLELVDINGSFLTGTGGRLHPADRLWTRLGRVFQHLDAQRQPDRSFAEVLASIPGMRPADRRMATQYVEGFEAADPTRISERALARSLNRPDGDGNDSARVQGGYDGIVNALAAPVGPRIKLQHIVTAVRWRPGEVELRIRSHSGRPLLTLSARVVLVTVPLGVLTAPPEAAARIAFDPPLPSQERAMQSLAVGAAIRVSLVLDEPFWLSRRFAARRGHRNFSNMSFVLAGSVVPFPAWWTAYPTQAPLLVGWLGGPRARAMSNQPRAAIVRDAIHSAAVLFGMSPTSVARQVRQVHTHDWNNDPFSLGAYSYACVGGATAAASLARPVKDTVYFAGEHVYGRGREGTVDGAIASGRHAAELVIRAAERSK